MPIPRVDLTGMLNEAELKWYNELTDENYQQLEEGFFTRVSNRRVIGNVGFPMFVKVCAGVGIKLQKKLDKKEAKGFAKLEKLGTREER